MPTDTPEPLLLPLAHVPATLGISRPHLARLRVRGAFGPAVLRLGRRLLVRRAELQAWVQAGMPPANEWAACIAAAGRRGPAPEAMKAATGRRSARAVG